MGLLYYIEALKQISDGIMYIIKLINMILFSALNIKEFHFKTFFFQMENFEVILLKGIPTVKIMKYRGSMLKGFLSLLL